MKNVRFKSPQSGFTLIELMIVLALAAIATVIGISLYSSNSAQTEIEREVRNLNSLVPLVKQTFMTAQGTYTGLTNAVMLTSKSFPTGMRSGNSTSDIRHSWDQNGVQLDPADYFGTPDDSFTITYSDVPGTACQDLMTRIYSFFEVVNIGGTDVTNVGTIATACNSGGPGSKTTIIVTTR